MVLKKYLLVAFVYSSAWLCTEIGDVAGAAEVTIRQAYKLMLPKAHSLFPEDFVFSTPIDMLPPQ